LRTTRTFPGGPVPAPAQRDTVTALGTGWNHELISTLYARIAERGYRFDRGSLPVACLRPRRTLPHVVHVQWIDRLVSTAPWPRRALGSVAHASALLVLRARHVPIIWTAHNVSAHDDHSAAWERAVQRLVIAVATVVVCPSEDTRRRLATLHPEVDAKAVVVPLPGYRPGGLDVSREDARAQLGVAPRQRVFLAFGGVRRYKGLTTLLRAFAGVPAPDASLVVAGTCKDEALARELTRLAAQDPRVVLDFGYQDARTASLRFAATDVVVLPYERSSNSGVAAMALAFGRPVLATDVGGMREMLSTEHGVAGWLCAAEMSSVGDALAAALDPAPAERARLTAAVGDASERVELGRVADAVADLYDRVTGRETVSTRRGDAAPSAPSGRR
jgi:glycosyltransferase involved in cell wall biosynthesis